MDCWAAWLSCRRQGGAELPEHAVQQLKTTRSRVLAGAGLGKGGVLLDVGCGDGLIGFGGVDIVGETGQVIFSDVSRTLLDRCRETASAAGLLARCRFVLSRADDLGQIADSSVDAVTTRSVLIYVANKAAALSEFHRVLKPGGRVSIFEPINRFIQSLEPPNEFAGYDLTPVADLWVKVRAVFDRVETPLIGPMLDFDERDLLRMASDAGFEELRLEFEAYVNRTPVEHWQDFYRSSGNPLAPTLEEALEEALDVAERARFTRHLKPLVEEGRGILRRAAAHVTAAKES